MSKELEQNIDPSIMDTFVALGVDLFFISICTKTGLWTFGTETFVYHLLLVLYLKKIWNIKC